MRTGTFASCDTTDNPAFGVEHPVQHYTFNIRYNLVLHNVFQVRALCTSTRRRTPRLPVLSYPQFPVGSAQRYFRIRRAILEDYRTPVVTHYQPLNLLQAIPPLVLSPEHSNPFSTRPVVYVADRDLRAPETRDKILEEAISVLELSSIPASAVRYQSTLTDIGVPAPILIQFIDLNFRLDP